MSSTPLLSIVTPSFNQAKFLKETLLSVYLQNYRPIEHIVIDGGSTDGSVEILERCAKEFQGPDYSLRWVSEKDRGFSDALGKGFARAAGEIIGWLNSDDVYFDRFVAETAMHTLGARTDADVVFGDVALISETGGLWMIWCFPNFKYERALRGYIVPQPTLFFRRKVAERHSIASLDAVGLDHAWYLEIGREHKFHHVGRVQAADRDHGARRTHTLPLWMEQQTALREKYGRGYDPSTFDEVCDQATKLLMRVKGLASWAWVYLNPRIANNLAFSPWIDSSWKVFRRQCTMRLRNRPDLGARPAVSPWAPGKVQPLQRADAPDANQSATVDETPVHELPQNTASTAPRL